MIKFFKKAPLAAGVVIAMASGGAQAISTGTDLNLTAKAAAGGMGGAAYTMPQEASAAVFGNPATLTQFKGFNMNFGASYLDYDLSSKDVSDNLGLTSGQTHTNDAGGYIVPDVGITLELAPGLVIGTGLEVDAGLGADYRDDPIMANILGGLNLHVELISFNANLAAGYEVTDKWSVGAAATVGFALFQVADSNGAASVAAGGAAGSSSSVHDIGFGLTLGTTYELQQGIMVSGTAKSPVKYSFNTVADAGGPALGAGTAGNWQDTDLEQPLELIVGVALDDVLMPGLLVEADVIWKNWGDADFYEDIFDDQFLIAVGAQLEAGDWTFRAGYSWAEDILAKPNASGTIGGLTHASGLVPFDAGALTIVQMSLTPVIWEHTVTAGIGYNFTPNVRVDAYGAYAFGESDDRTYTINPAAPLGAAFGLTGVQEANAQQQWMIGAGLNVAMP